MGASLFKAEGKETKLAFSDGGQGLEFQTFRFEAWVWGCGFGYRVRFGKIRISVSVEVRIERLAEDQGVLGLANSTASGLWC